MTRKIKIGEVSIGGKSPLVFIAGPCVIETEKLTLKIAERLKKLSDTLNVPLIFKSSYDKANRTSVKSYRGPGLKEGLRILEKVKKTTGMPVLSDIHSVEEISQAAEVLDVLQIPAFLCRQTDLIIASAKTGKPVNIKKGQFLSPWDVKNVIDKLLSTGNNNIIITERGTSFGYNNLVVDFRGLPIIRSYGYPVIFDVTHSLQLPGGQGSSSGGQIEFAEPLARAAVAVDVDGLFLEVHLEPDKALCDGPNMLSMDKLTSLIQKVIGISKVVRKYERGRK
ncbi:MAG: 3-deoxy-8-phosphooctulonate synthase [Nitrospirae bacterium]|nr:3-deoxy-8-phosphooctulonate synthase [Nitrospirota bacterium]